MNNLSAYQMTEETGQELVRLGITTPTIEQVKEIQQKIREKHEKVITDSSNPQWDNSHKKALV